MRSMADLNLTDVDPCLRLDERLRRLKCQRWELVRLAGITFGFATKLSGVHFTASDVRLLN